MLARLSHNRFKESGRAGQEQRKKIRMCYLYSMNSVVFFLILRALYTAPIHLNFMVPETIGNMVIDHTGGLHVGINYRGTHKFESPFFEVFRYFI